MEIRKTKLMGEPIDWDDYKSMSFTRAVEHLRKQFVTSIKRSNLTVTEWL